MAANTVQMLYHVGIHDYGMHPTIIDELVPPRDFGIDPREGRPTISTLESLQQVVSDHETGLILGERWRWGSASAGFTRDVARFIYETMEEVPMPAARELVLYRWGAPAVGVPRSGPMAVTSTAVVVGSGLRRVQD